MPSILFLVTEDWYFKSHRLPLAVALRKQGYDVVLVTRISEDQAAIEAAGLRVIHFEMNRRGLNPLGLIREALALARTYRQEKPDLLHHVALRPVVVGAIAARLAKISRVVSAIAGLGFLFTAGGRHPLVVALLKVGLPWLLARGSVVVQNQDDGQFLADLGVSNGRICLIPGAGVDVGCFRPRMTESTKTPLVMLAARMLWDKGVGEFVASARALRGQARFVLVGPLDDDNPAAVPRSQIESWLGEDVVEWWGARADMPEVLREATIFCLPSYREGMPKGLLEAMATGLACVSSIAPGCRDAVEDGESGLLVPVRDAGALTEAIRRLLADANLRARLGAAARRRVMSEFSSARAIDATLAIYRELLS